MTVHIISVGTGILDYLADNEDAISAVSEWTSVGTTWLNTDWFPTSAVSNIVTADAQPLSDAVPTLDWTRVDVPHGIWPQQQHTTKAPCADLEMMTYAAPAQQDTVVLLASDTLRGLASAIWVALLMRTRQSTWNVRYAQSSAATPDLAVPGIVIVRLLGLRAGETAEFTSAMEGLGDVGAAAYRANTSVRFHLSGGYKATIPFLLSMAEGVRTLVEQRADDEGRLDGPGVTAEVRYEETPPDSPDVVSLPLRLYSLDTLKKIFGQADINGVLSPDPVHPTVRGSVLDDATPPKLTAFGRGLRVLFNAAYVNG